MKAKKMISLLTASAMLFSVTLSCVGTAYASSNASLLSEVGLDSNLRFEKARTIVVEIFDRTLDNGRTKPEDNFYTDWIKEGMLRDHNVNVVFEPVPRWTEQEVLNNLLAAGDAPDVCITYSYPTVKTYAEMGGVTDLAPLLEKYKEILPNMWDLLTDYNIYHDKDPEKGTLWAIETLLYNSARINTFVREDWLNKLGLPAPTTLEEFESMLYAFKDNAVLLLGKDAGKMVPFSSSYDFGWRANNLLASFISTNLTDKELNIMSYDDRQFLLPGYKEGVRVLNKWYNEGLMWADFPLYGPGDQTEENTILKAGYAGSMIHNWDLPYRDGENGVQGTLKRVVGEDTAYIAIDPFVSDDGSNRKFMGGRVDRKIFFPNTNEEPVASLLYVDWISKFENRNFLQIGEEGVTHEIQADGTVKLLSAAGTPKIMNSPNNIDYTLTINGIDMGSPEASAPALLSNYAGVDPSYIVTALSAAFNDGFVIKRFNFGDVKSETGVGEALRNKRDAMLTQAVVAKPENFDAVYDKGMQNYLNSGGQAIIDERTKIWESINGSETMLP